jgi:uncharacterized protein (TIGR00299 family) protein
VEKIVFYIDGNAGASGDMLLSALLDLGFPAKTLEKFLKALHPSFGVMQKKIWCGGMFAKRIVPKFPPSKPNGSLENFLDILKKSKLSLEIKKKASDIFKKLADVEGEIHGKKPQEVTFHELGGWDTLLDVVGVLAGFNFFHPSEIFVGPLNVGSGWVKTKHGSLPVPPPAVVKLLSGFFVYASEAKTELVTPTGALLLSSLAKPVPAMPSMLLKGCGVGAGEKKLSFPNVLRIFLGESLEPLASDRILKLETNVDDMNPQLWEHVMETLYEKGALEVFLTPVVMKKSRPATLLTVLSPLEKEEVLVETLFKETTTLGVRKEVVTRRLLQRDTVTIKTSLGEIPCKVGHENGVVVNVMPEYSALKHIAEKRKLPLKQVYQGVLKELPKNFPVVYPHNS